jgi:protein-S-isoprenylcysteine O-methyltransferase Ste14
VTHAAHLVVLLDFCAVASLPRVFFRPGTFNARWCLTATPFALAALAVLAAWLGVVDPWGGDDGFAVLTYLGAVLSAASLYLIGFTMGANRVPLALWHQDDDAPVEIVTWGPYAWIRHPFYTSFLAAFVAAVLVAPGPATLVPAGLGGIALGITARREERHLLASPLGPVYARYAGATGRFLPDVGRLR